MYSYTQLCASVTNLDVERDSLFAWFELSSGVVELADVDQSFAFEISDVDESHSTQSDFVVILN